MDTECDTTDRYPVVDTIKSTTKCAILLVNVSIIEYCGKGHLPVKCNYGSKAQMVSLISYQFDRVIEEELRWLLGIVQGDSIFH